MARPEKIDTVEKISKLFEESNSFFITDYQGLNVPDMTSLRKKLRESKVRYLVAKNTLYKLAADKSGLKEVGEHFAGPTAVAFTSDEPSAAAKVLYDSYKDKELPRIKVFVVDDEVFQGEDIKRLADLPPRDVLMSQVVAAVESPLSSLVSSLDAFFTELVGTLDALSEKKKSES